MSKRGRINEFGEFVRGVVTTRNTTNATTSSNYNDSSNPLGTFIGGLLGFSFCYLGFYDLFGLGEPGETSKMIMVIVAIVFGFYSVGMPGSASKSWVIAIIIMALSSLVSCENSENLETTENIETKGDSPKKLKNLVKLNSKQIDISEEQFSELMKLVSLELSEQSSCKEYRYFISGFFLSMENITFDDRLFNLQLTDNKGKEINIYYDNNNGFPNCKFNIMSTTSITGFN